MKNPNNMASTALQQVARGGKDKGDAFIVRDSATGGLFDPKIGWLSDLKTLGGGKVEVFSGGKKNQYSAGERGPL